MTTDTEVAAQRHTLEVERSSLRNEMAELGALEYDANFADSSQVNAERGETNTLVAKLRSVLADVDLALAKLDGTSLPAYGTCEGCGKAIAGARLEAMPAARRCVGCAAG